MVSIEMLLALATLALVSGVVLVAGLVLVVGVGLVARHYHQKGLQEAAGQGTVAGMFLGGGAALLGAAFGQEEARKGQRARQAEQEVQAQRLGRDKAMAEMAARQEALLRDLQAQVRELKAQQK